MANGSGEFFTAFRISASTPMQMLWSVTKIQSPIGAARNVEIDDKTPVFDIAG
jgi:hypothetical protein